MILERQKRSVEILKKHRDDLIRIRDELLEKKTIEGERVIAIVEELRAKYPADVGSAGQPG